MGGPMIRRLVGFFNDVSGYDHSDAARKRLSGQPIRIVADVADLEGSDVVVLMLPDSNAVEDVVLTQQLSRFMEPGSTIIDMSSSDPHRTRDLAENLATAGVALLDAPVSGGVAGAESGQLSIMVGGAPEELERWVPLLGRFGSHIVRVGEVGSGHAAKALNNLLSAAGVLLTGEMLLVALRFGIEPDVLLEVINESSGRNWASQYKFPRFVLTRTFASGFSADLMAKDVNIALGVARETGVDVPVGAGVVARWAELAHQLDRGADHTEVVRVLEQAAGVELRTNASPDG
jgi:3-hydroxyisobutyrate dehydrogenase